MSGKFNRPNEGILSNMEDETQNIKQVSIAVCHISELSDEVLHLFMVITTGVYCSLTRILHATIRTFTHPYLRTIHNVFPVSFYVYIYIHIYISLRLGKLSQVIQ